MNCESIKRFMLPLFLSITTLIPTALSNSVLSSLSFIAPTVQCRMNSISRVLNGKKSLITLAVRYISSQTMDLAVDNEGIAILTLNNPPVNSFNLERLQEMNRYLDEINKLGVKGAIITSAIPNIFCAGFDLMEMYKPDLHRAEIFWTVLQNVFYKLIGSNYPTAAVINGHSPGGGCMLTLACEYRVMVGGSNYKIGLNEAAVGFATTPWIQALMYNVMTNKDTERALTAGTLFTAKEALEFGLVDELASNKENGIERSRTFFRKFEKVQPDARALTKQRTRSIPLKILTDNCEEDAKMFLDILKDQKMQHHLGMYINNITKKGKSLGEKVK